MKIVRLQTSLQSPWQNGVAERWVGSCRRDLLDHVIALNEPHLKRVLSDYVHYYHEDRTHLGLNKENPNGRPRLAPTGRVIAHRRLGGPAPPLRSCSVRSGSERFPKFSYDEYPFFWPLRGKVAATRYLHTENEFLLRRDTLVKIAPWLVRIEFWRVTTRTSFRTGEYIFPVGKK